MEKRREAESSWSTPACSCTCKGKEAQSKTCFTYSPPIRNTNKVRKFV